MVDLPRIYGRMATEDPSDDVGASLSELERKLVALETELQSVASGSPGVREPLPVPGDETELEDRPDPAVRIQDLRSEIVALVRFRDQLESVSRNLIEEYDRLIERLKGGGGADAAHHAPIGGGAARHEPAPAPTAEEPAPAADPEAAVQPAQEVAPEGAAQPAQPAPAAPPAGAQTVEGALVLDVGPFASFTTLSSFEQALARVPGAEDVYVRSFTGDRALIDVRLAEPVDLLQALRESASLPIMLREAVDGRLTIDLTSDDPSS